MEQLDFKNKNKERVESGKSAGFFFFFSSVNSDKLCNEFLLLCGRKTEEIFKAIIIQIRFVTEENLTSAFCLQNIQILDHKPAVLIEK